MNEEHKIKEEAMDTMVMQLSNQFRSCLPEILNELKRAIKEEADETGTGKVDVTIKFILAAMDMKYIKADGNISYKVKSNRKIPVEMEIDMTPNIFKKEDFNVINPQ